MPSRSEQFVKWIAAQPSIPELDVIDGPYPIISAYSTIISMARWVRDVEKLDAVDTEGWTKPPHQEGEFALQAKAVVDGSKQDPLV